MRLIDADKLIENKFKNDISYNAFCSLVKRQPVVKERKKGKWIKMSDADGIYWACSECGEDIPRTESIDKKNYCPNCGADMRGDNDE